jgi:hypothetical protein
MWQQPLGYHSRSGGWHRVLHGTCCAGPRWLDRSQVQLWRRAVTRSAASAAAAMTPLQGNGSAWPCLRVGFVSVQQHVRVMCELQLLHVKEQQDFYLSLPPACSGVVPVTAAAAAAVTALKVVGVTEGCGSH